MELDAHQDEVLIAMDGSLPSQIAATLACQIATFQHQKVKGLFVVNEHYILDRYADFQPELGPIELPSSRAELIDLFKLKGEKAMEWLETLCRSMDVPFEYEIMLGFVPEEITRQSKTAKLVAFGKKGFHQPEHGSHLGENFHQFIHRVHAPFIAGDKELRPVRSLLVGYNGSPSANRALEWAAMIGEAFQAKIYVTHVMNNDRAKENAHTREIAQRLEATVQKSQLQNDVWVVLEGDPADQLAKAAIQYDVDLLVVGCGKSRTGMNWLKGTTLDRILQNIRLTTFVG